MARDPRFPRGGWTGTPAPPPPPNPFLKLVAQAILERTEGDDAKFLCFTNSEPSVLAFENLPGATKEAKVGYFLDWLEEGFERGLTAYDLFGSEHDTAALVRAAPRLTTGGTRIEDPAAAVAVYFPEPWYGTRFFRAQAEAVAANPAAADNRLAIYRKRAG